MNDFKETQIHVEGSGRSPRICKHDLNQFNQKVRVHYRYWPYGWLRIPSVLLGCIGILGIMSRRIDVIRQALEFMNIPPMTACYVITLGACILFGFSMIYHRCNTDMISKKADASTTHEYWRSI